jgi:hypothetical protein
VSVGKELVTPNLSITELYVALQQLKVLCNNGSNLWLPIMGCLLGCIPTIQYHMENPNPGPKSLLLYALLPEPLSVGG